MSYQKIQDMPVQPNEVRDFFSGTRTRSTDYTVDLWQEHLVIGLDILLHNRGAAPIYIDVDKQNIKVVLAGETFTWSNVKYALVEITAAVTFDLVLAGVRRSKKKRA